MNIDDLTIGKIGRWEGVNKECSGMLCMAMFRIDSDGYYIIPLNSKWYSPWKSFRADTDKIIYDVDLSTINFDEIRNYLKKLYKNENREIPDIVRITSLLYLEALNYINEYEYSTIP